MAPKKYNLKKFSNVLSPSIKLLFNNLYIIVNKNSQ